MKVAVEELGACKRRLQVEEAAEVVQQAWERAFARVQKQARLPGFRKGKVPRSMVKLHFADDVRQEVARHLIPETYRQALAEARLEPVEDPDLQEVTLEENAALRFSAVVEVKPPIALGQYTGLRVAFTPKPFDEHEVDEALEHLREQQAEYRAVERAADVGDLVIVDYTLTPEGMEPRSESGYGFVVGSGAVMPEIEEAVIGLPAAGSRTARLRFPEDHRSEALRGKPGEAQVRVVEVKEKVLPALDDGFAKSVSSAETLETLRAEVRRGLQARRDADNQRALEGAVLDAALAGHAFEVPEALVLRQVGLQVERAREHVRQQGLDPDRLPWDYQKMLEELRPGAEKTVRRALLVEAVARQEGLEPGPADLDAEVERLARASQRPAPALRRVLEQNGELERVRLSLRDRRTLEFLIAKNPVTETTAPAGA